MRSSLSTVVEIFDDARLAEGCISTEHYRWCSMKRKRAASIYPTVDEINALPEKFRQYIHDLETRCDKSGDVQTIAILREDREALQRRVEELEVRIALQKRGYLETPIETD
jgi:hypothetical protein